MTFITDLSVIMLKDKGNTRQQKDRRMLGPAAEKCWKVLHVCRRDKYQTFLVKYFQILSKIHILPFSHSPSNGATRRLTEARNRLWIKLKYKTSDAEKLLEKYYGNPHLWDRFMVFKINNSQRESNRLPFSTHSSFQAYFRETWGS